jgi:hypothetical protein
MKTKKIKNMFILSGIIISLLINPAYGFEHKNIDMLSPRIAINSIELKTSANSFVNLNLRNENLTDILVNLSDEQAQIVRTVNNVINEKGETYFRARSRKTEEWQEFVIKPLIDEQEAKKLDDALQAEGVRHFSWENNVHMLKESAKFDKKGFIYAVYQLDSNGNDSKIVAAANSFIENPGYKTKKYLHTYNVEVLLSARNEFSGVGTKLFVRRMLDTLRPGNIEVTQGRLFFTAASDTAVDRSPYTFYVKLGLKPAIGREQAEQDNRYKLKGTDFDLSMDEVIDFLGNQLLGFAPDLETLKSQALSASKTKKEVSVNKIEQEKNKALETFNRVINSKTYASLQRVFNYDDTIYPYKAVYVGPVKNIEKVEEFLSKSIDIFEKIINRFENSLEVTDRDMIQMYLNDLNDFSLSIVEFKQKNLSTESAVSAALANSAEGVKAAKQDGIEVPDYIMNMLNAKSDTALVDQAKESAFRTKPVSDLITLDLIDSAI